MMARALLPFRLLRPIKNVPYRALNTTCRSLAAHEFKMPAMSPTMTEGNIASWRIQEGDTFSAGDVLLEIETDKAQMDVEAQEDGIMAQIIQQAGSKNVKVGTRIAITADPEDDIQTLDTSALHSSQVPSYDSAAASDETPKPQPKSILTHDRHDPQGEGRNSQYPLFPSVTQLVHEHGLSESDVSKMIATGPNRRLLKGDVLAYLGTISSKYPKEQSKRIEALGHLDLSNIEIERPRPQPNSTSDSSTSSKSLERETEKPSISEVTLPISLTSINDVRRKIRETMGVSVDFETIIARAARLCNDNLPRSRNLAPTSNELFNAVLGLDGISEASSGPSLVPYIQPIQTTSTRLQESNPRTIDIIDELTSNVFSNTSYRVNKEDRVLLDSSSTFFTVKVPAGDEIRGKVFLQRLKTTLQTNPGQLLF